MIYTNNYSYAIRILKCCLFNISKLLFVIILDDNKIGVEGTKALSEALKINKNLTKLDLGKIMQLFT